MFPDPTRALKDRPVVCTSIWSSAQTFKLLPWLSHVWPLLGTPLRDASCAPVPCIFPHGNLHPPRTRTLWECADDLFWLKARPPWSCRGRGVWFLLPPEWGPSCAATESSCNLLFKAQIGWDWRRPARGSVCWLQTRARPSLPSSQSQPGLSNMSPPVLSSSKRLCTWVWRVQTNDFEDRFCLLKLI